MDSDLVEKIWVQNTYIIKDNAIHTPRLVIMYNDIEFSEGSTAQFGGTDGQLNWAI